MQWLGGNADFREVSIMASACTGQCGITVGGQPPPHTVTPVRHAGDMEFLERIVQEHSALQDGGEAEMTAFGGGGGKVSDLKGVQRLQALPRDGPVLQIPR